MTRVQFVETVTVPLGPGGSLIPLAGVAAIPYVVDINGNEGGQANAYSARTGSVAAPSNNTDSTGTISFWLDAGDYNVHFVDQQSPPRITAYTRGFTAPIIDTNQIVVASQNLIQFTGDTKFSLQASDHGLKSDGSYEWLLVTSDVDGGGRWVDGVTYGALWVLLGSPALTSGKFRLPNVSGRALIAAGGASGLTVRHLLDQFGTESENLDINHIPSHGHTLDGSGTGMWIDAAPTGISASIAGAFTGISASIANANAIANPSFYAPIRADSNIFSAGSGSSGASAWAGSVNTVGWVGTQMGHSHGLNWSDPGHAHGLNWTDPWHNHTLHDPGHGHTLHASGGGLAHNNVGPSTGMNLFVKT